MAPSRAALVALITLVALGGAFVLGLYALTDVAERSDMLGRLTPALAAVVAGVPGLLAWLRGEQLARSNAAQTAQLGRVESQTNGHLTARLEAQRGAIVADVVAAAGKDAGNPIALKDYVRFQLGEGIEKEESDFAAEVAAAAGVKKDEPFA